MSGNNLVQQVDACIDSFLFDGDADQFFLRICRLDFDAEEEPPFVFVMKRLLDKQPAQAGPALMFVAMGISQDPRRPAPC